MASPRIEVFFVYNENTGAPIPGIVASMSFDTYKKDDGTNVTTPSFVEIGGGAYYFTPVFADTTHGISYIINTSGSPVTPSRVARFMRPEDWTTDPIPELSASIANMSGAADYSRKTLQVLSGSIDTIYKVEKGRWKLASNQLTIYDTDAVSPLLTFNLKDAFGNPTTTGSFERIPT